MGNLTFWDGPKVIELTVRGRKASGVLTSNSWLGSSLSEKKNTLIMYLDWFYLPFSYHGGHKQHRPTASSHLQGNLVFYIYLDLCFFILQLVDLLWEDCEQSAFFELTIIPEMHFLILFFNSDWTLMPLIVVKSTTIVINFPSHVPILNLSVK